MICLKKRQLMSEEIVFRFLHKDECTLRKPKIVEEGERTETLLQLINLRSLHRRQQFSIRNQSCQENCALNSTTVLQSFLDSQLQFAKSEWASEAETKIFWNCRAEIEGFLPEKEASKRAKDDLAKRISLKGNEQRHTWAWVQIWRRWAVGSLNKIINECPDSIDLLRKH